MGSPVDLTLGCSNQQAPSSNGFHDDYRNVALHPAGYLESLRKAEEYLRTLEEERRKVEGFKRELPLCIQLLENAIKTSKEKLVNGKDLPALRLTCSSMDSGKERNVSSPRSRPTLEEFMPMKRRWEREQASEGSYEERESERGNKRPAWMAEAQLWNQSCRSAEVVRDEKEIKSTEQLEQEQSSVTSSQLLLSSKQRPAGAFLPFIREQPSSASLLLSRPTPKSGSGADLSLSLGERVTSPSGHTLRASDSEVGSIDAGLQTPEPQITKDIGTSGAGSSSGGGNSSRKARRCWSPELHRRFVNALHQLGGSQIATPKQIRELMKVDGLTNDEVKSHLQKYRLHTRRPSSSPQSAAAGQSPQLVVLGGIWMPPQYAATTSSQPSSGAYDPSSGHPPQPAQFCQSSLPQEYFACISNGTPGAPLQMHRQPIFEPQQAGTSQSQSSPQGSLQVTSQLSGATQGPSSTEVYYDESGEEEAKSDSTSWKCRREGNQNGQRDEPKKVNLKHGEVASSGNGPSEGRASEEEVNQVE